MFRRTLVSALSIALCASTALAQDLAQAQSEYFTAGQDLLAERVAAQPNTNQAMNVILFVADGMGVGTNYGIRVFQGQEMGLLGEEHNLPYDLYPNSAIIKTYNINAQTPDSAPTAGAMGYGFPAAIAAKLRHPERPVVAFAGDGCFMMTSQELATAMKYGANVITLVVNNGMYGTIRMHQARNYPGRRADMTLTNPNFAEFARSFGAYGAVVEETSDFDRHDPDGRLMGSRVVFVGLTDLDMNGTTGFATEFDGTKQRYIVHLES